MLPCHHCRAMDIHFLGGATTVTGSQYLLETERAKVLIDCGMFQGSPDESIRNRVPFAFDPAELDAMLLTHAHLDHCGLIPLLVKDGLPRADPCDRRDDRAGRARPARLGQAPRGVRQARRALGDAPSRQGRGRGPRGRRRSTQAAVALAADGERSTPGDGGRRRPATAAAPSTSRRAIEPASGRRRPRTGRATRRPSSRAQPPDLEVDLDEPLYTAKDAERVARQFQAVALRPGVRGRARASTPRSSMPATSSARRSSGCGSPTARAARSGSSSSRATWAGRTRRSCATRPR